MESADLWSAQGKCQFVAIMNVKAECPLRFHITALILNVPYLPAPRSGTVILMVEGAGIVPTGEA